MNKIYLSLKDPLVASKLQNYLNMFFNNTVYVYNNNSIDYLDILVYEEDTINISHLQLLSSVLLVNKEEALSKYDVANVFILPLNLNNLVVTLKNLLASLSNALVIKHYAFIYKINESNLVDFKNSVIVTNFRNKEALLLKELFVSYPSGINKAHILQSVWGFSATLNTNTLETHLALLRKKLQEVSLKIIKVNDVFSIHIE